MLTDGCLCESLYASVVDFDELAAGISVFCVGDAAEKMKAVFELFDYDGDKHLGRAELQRYLRSVFAVMIGSYPESEGTARVHRMVDDKTVDIDTLATATANAAFDECTYHI